MWVGSIQSSEAPGKLKGRGKANLLSLLELRPIFSCPWTSLVLLVLRLLGSNQDLTPSASHSQDFRLRLNYITGFPGSPDADLGTWPSQLCEPIPMIDRQIDRRSSRSSLTSSFPFFHSVSLENPNTESTMQVVAVTLYFSQVNTFGWAET